MKIDKFPYFLNIGDLYCSSWPGLGLIDRGKIVEEQKKSDAEVTEYIAPHVGPLFRDFVASVVTKRQARSYLEVGVRDGATLSLINCDSIGVDPNFVFTTNPIGKKNKLHLYQMTSDEFFRSVDPREIFGCSVDVVFLDGLHLFEFLLRDFINSEKICSEKSLIMLDDCLPVNVEMTERYHNPSQRSNKNLATWWTGDVWKVVDILSEYRPDLRITPVDTSPTGNVCVTQLNPRSTTLENNYFDIIDNYKNKKINDEVLKNFRKKYETVSAEKIMNKFDWGLEL